MKDLAEFSIAVVELLEAEGRSFRKGVARLGVMGILLLLGSALAAVGLGLCLRAVYLWLSANLAPPAAAGVVGAVSLLLSGVVVWIAVKTGS